MDDLNAQATPQQLAEEAWHTEQRRKQYDIIRVKNPAIVTVKGIQYELDTEDFYVEYDTNQWQKISFNTTVDIPQYIAIRYVEHKKDDIVNKIVKKMHDEFIEMRRLKGMPDYKDKASENAETYETASYPKTNDENVIAELYNQLWIGIVHKIGQDKPPQTINPRSGEVNTTPTSEKVLNNLSTKWVSPSESPIEQYKATPTPPPASHRPPEVPKPSGFATLNQKLTAEDITNE